MTFITLSGTQVLALSLLTAGVVVALFFLRLRQRRIVVGSSLLWQRVLDEPRNVSLMERLRRWISLALALLIALLIVVSLGRPYRTASGDPLRPLVLVLDNSPSMNALRADGNTRWSAATETAHSLLNAASPAGFMIADTTDGVRTLLGDEEAAAELSLTGIHPRAGRHRFPDLPAADVETVFITDGVDPIDVPPGTDVLSVFEAADNVAITAFEVQVDPTSPSGYSAYAEVVNYSPGPKDVAILLSGTGERRIGDNVRLGPAEAWRQTFDLADMAGGGLRLRIQAEGDALSLDDTAFSYLPVRNDTRVMLVTADAGGYLATLLGLSPKVDLTVVEPALYREETGTDIYVFDGFAPPQRPDRPSLVFGAAPVSWLPLPTGSLGPTRITEWDPEHPIMRFVPVEDLQIRAAARVRAEGWHVLAGSGETPLIAAEEDPADTVFVGFELADSDFPLSLGFPIFVENVLASFAGGALAETRPLGTIELPSLTSEVTTLDGTALPIEERDGRKAVEVSEPDLLTAVAGGRRLRVAANLADPRSSDINRGSGRAAGERADSLLSAGTDLWFAALLAVLLLAATEWWTYHRRITL